MSVDDTDYGCAALTSKDRDDVTEVTRLLRDLDECIEASNGNLRSVEEKAAQLERQLREDRPSPERVRRALRESQVPRAEPDDGGAEGGDAGDSGAVD